MLIILCTTHIVKYYTRYPRTYSIAGISCVHRAQGINSKETNILCIILCQKGKPYFIKFVDIFSHGGIGYAQKAEEVYEIIIMSND